MNYDTRLSNDLIVCVVWKCGGQKVYYGYADGCGFNICLELYEWEMKEDHQQCMNEGWGPSTTMSA